MNLVKATESPRGPVSFILPNDNYKPSIQSSGYRLRWSEPSSFRNTPLTTWKVLSNVCFVPLSQGYQEGKQNIKVVLRI